MDKDKLRPIEVVDKYDNVIFAGLFHRWAASPRGDYAIVEDKEGFIRHYQYCSWDFRFPDRGEGNTPGTRP